MFPKDAYKELAPVLYGENGLKLNKFSYQANAMCFPAHWHDRIELLLIISGSLEVYLDSEHFTVLPGQAVAIMPSMVHCGLSGEQDVCYYVIAIDIDKFSNDTVASAKYLMPISTRTLKFESFIKTPEIIALINELIDALQAPPTRNPLHALGKTYELIGALYEHCSISLKQPNKLDERFGKVLKYINSHYTEDISAKFISREFGYEEAYFCRRFKELTGITTMNYIRILRLELAQKLLKETNENINNISWKCGYADTHYFSNCFKRHFGMTPTQWRQTKN